jgi:hypothetical protein
MRAMAAALCWLVADGRALADGHRLVAASHFAGAAGRRAGCGWDAAGYPGRGGHTYFIVSALRLPRAHIFALQNACMAWADGVIAA